MELLGIINLFLLIASVFGLVILFNIVRALITMNACYLVEAIIPGIISAGFIGFSFLLLHSAIIPSLAGSWQATLSTGHRSEVVIFEGGHMVWEDGFLYLDEPQSLSFTINEKRSLITGIGIDTISLFDSEGGVAEIDLLISRNNTIEGVFELADGTSISLRLERLNND